MNSIDLRERLRKAEENVFKIQKTIERLESQAQKKLAKIEENGWTLDKHEYCGEAYNDEAYWTICEYEDKVGAANNARERLHDADRVRNNWKDRLERQLEIERKIQTEIPEVFKEAQKHLVDEWTTWDIQARELMHERKKELRKEYNIDIDWSVKAQREFSDAWRKLYTYSREESLTHTDEEFRKMNEKSAEDWLLDLYNRVYNITGHIVDCSGIHWGGKALDGIVVGESGSAEVETIDAGGYNDGVLLDSGRHGQRWHLRILVKKLK